jgi:AcrR family transcriptional regulator
MEEKFMTKKKQLNPYKEPQQSRSKVTYDAILEATTHILIEKGYAATTTNHIAERAGISIGSLYQYFPNTEAITVELLNRHIVEGPDYMKSRIANSIKYELNPVKVVNAFIEAACARHSDNPALHKVLTDEVPHPEHIREALKQNEFMNII